VSNGASSLDTPVGVLVCDDNAAMRALLGVVVGTSPGLATVGEASDGDEAIAQATRLQPDVILLDLAMPNRSGLEALAELRYVAPAAQIVVLSGFALTAAAEEVFALGAAAYLEKGSSPQAIITTIENAVANARHVQRRQPKLA
jgi:DNA-binding NarL/FixJ family response regulator